MQIKKNKGSDDPIQLYNKFEVLEERGDGEEPMELSGKTLRAKPGGSTGSVNKPQISKG